MNYTIINTGSVGNATVLNNNVLIDCGIPFSKIKSYLKDLQLVLLTHIHQDHFNKSTIKKIAKERPSIRFGCCEWLLDELLDLGVSKNQIDVYEIGTKYSYTDRLSIKPVKLYHDVPNCGYRLFIDDYKCIYCTDTKTLDGIKAIGYDYYFIEANYESEEELHNRAYNEIYENRVKNTHLSREKATNWLLENMRANSIYEFMHQHKERKNYEI